MSQYDIKGGNAIIETDVLGDMLPLVCVKTFSINTIADVKETTTAGNGLWKSFDYDRLSATLTVTGLTQIIGEDGKPTFYDLFDAMLNFLEIGIRIKYIDNSGNPAIIACTVIVNNNLFDANPIKLLNSSVTMLVTGQLYSLKPDEANTITFKRAAVDFTSTNQLTAVQNSYKVSDKAVMSTTGADSDQAIKVTFLLPKSTSNYGDEYGGATNVGLTNVDFISAVETGSNWLVTYQFDYEPSTLNKQLNILLN